MISELTQEQGDNISKTRKKYLDIFYNPKNKDIPKEVYVEQYNDLYEFIGLPKPKKVIVMDSPLGVQVAYNLLRNNLGGNLWNNLRDNLRDNLSNNLRDNLEDNLRGNLWNNLEDNLGGDLRSNLRSNLQYNLETNLEDKLRINLRDISTGHLKDDLRYILKTKLAYKLESRLRGNSLGYKLWTKLRNIFTSNLQYNLETNLEGNLSDHLDYNLRSNLQYNLETNLEGNLQYNLRDNLRDKSKTSFSYYGESTDIYWVAYYMYVVENFGFVHKYLENRLRRYEKIITTAPTMLNTLFPEVAIVSRTPIKCFRDNEGKLHNDEGGLAVEFADGWGLYAINGVIFDDEKLYLSIVNKTITAEEVAELVNTEQRMIALKYLSPKEFIKGSKAKQVGLPTAKGNTLYKGSFKDIDEVWFLRFKCPSTGREYIEFTDPNGWGEDIKAVNGGNVDIYNPDVLQAYSFIYEYGGKSEHLSVDDYLSMRVET